MLRIAYCYCAPPPEHLVTLFSPCPGLVWLRMAQYFLVTINRTVSVATIPDLQSGFACSPLTANKFGGWDGGLCSQ